MAKVLTIFKSTTGINNRVDPVRLKFNPETGITQLAEGVNIDIDSTGRINRRRGYERKRLESCHSLWAEGEDCFYVSGGALFRLFSDYTRKGIRSGLSNASFSFVKVNGEVFYCNGKESGVIRGDVSYGWSSTVLPTGHITTRVLSPPPMGGLLGYNSGRVLIASGSILWYTEPFAYYHCDLGKNFIKFDSSIVLLAPTVEGTFIGTEESIFFLKGKDIDSSELIKVADYGVVKGTLAKVDSGLLPEGFKSEGAVNVWMSKKGICLGSSSGEFFNVTRKFIKLPDASKGTGLCIGSSYIGLLDS